MAAPTADSYTAPAGARNIRLGRGVPYTGPALSLSGALWSPNRDGAGNVLLSDFQALPLQTWVDAGTATMDSVVANPRLPELSGADGSPNIMAAWGGAAWDYDLGRLLIWGGGHANSHDCENGVYAASMLKMSWTRIKDRSALAALTVWDGSALVPSASPGFNANNHPLLDNAPGSKHSYNGLCYLPPSALGNTSGGLYIYSGARSVLDFDTGNWLMPGMDLNTLTGGVVTSLSTTFVDGNTVYVHSGNTGNRHHTHVLAGTSATAWNAASFGVYTQNAITNSFLPYANKLVCWLRERREYFRMGADGTIARLRYGAAIDASQTTWTPYIDTITLTSSDGSHADFNSTALTMTAGPPSNPLGDTGTAYDHTNGCIWVVPNGTTAMYKITGLSGSTWTVEKLPASTNCRRSNYLTYGRFAVRQIGNCTVGIRTPTTTSPIEAIVLARA